VAGENERSYVSFGDAPGCNSLGAARWGVRVLTTIYNNSVKWGCGALVPLKKTLGDEALVHTTSVSGVLLLKRGTGERIRKNAPYNVQGETGGRKPRSEPESTSQRIRGKIALNFPLRYKVLGGRPHQKVNDGDMRQSQVLFQEQSVINLGRKTKPKPRNQQQKERTYWDGN